MALRTASMLVAALAFSGGAFGQCGSAHALTVTGSYSINGVARPVLRFVAGQSYTFTCQNASLHPFMLTASSTGGGGASPLPASFGISCQCTACGSGCSTNTITWNVPATLSGSFFYQCNVHMNLGNRIDIISLPVVSDQPDPQELCSGDALSLSVVADTPDHVALTYQWRLDGQPISGATSPVYSVGAVGTGDGGVYDCVVTNQCASVTSEPALVGVGDCCTADFDGDGFVTGLDYDLYVQAFENGDLSADFDGDGFISGIDFDLFVIAFEKGC